MQQTETRIQMIKMVNEFKLTVVHFARPNPMQICACAWIYRWTKRLWKIRTGPPGLWAARPPGLRTAGPSRAVGRGPAFSKTPCYGAQLDSVLTISVDKTATDWILSS